MIFAVLLSLALAAHAAPGVVDPSAPVESMAQTASQHPTESKQTDSQAVTPVTEEKKPTEPDLPYAVKRFNYKLPAYAYSEGRSTNDGLFFVRFPHYSMNIHLMCPYELVETEFLTQRITDKGKDKCVSMVELTYWDQEHHREILLDTYKIAREDLSDRYSLDSITVYKSPEGRVHHVTLAMENKTCRMMEYTVTDTFKVETNSKIVDCKVVDQLNKENDQWVSDHVAKAVAAAAAKGKEAALQKELNEQTDVDKDEEEKDEKKEEKKVK